MFGNSEKRFICQGVVCGAWDHRACVLLPAPSASDVGLSGSAGNAARTIGRCPAGTKGAGASRQSAADHQGRDSGDPGCRPRCRKQCNRLYPGGNRQGEQSEDLSVLEASADRDPEAHGQYQPDLLGRPPPLIGELAGGMPQTNINATNWASAKNGAQSILDQGTNGWAFTFYSCICTPYSVSCYAIDCKAG